MTTCKHCNRTIVNGVYGWIDPEATGDDAVWSETCDAHDTFTAEHEPANPIGAPVTIDSDESDIIAEASPYFDVVGFVMDFESGLLEEEDIIEGFQHLVDTGLAWSLQGAYGRMADALINEGLVTR